MITTYLSPKLRDLGFKGGGFNFIKQEGHIIQTIQICGDRCGGQGWVEVGVHLDFLPDAFNLPIDLKKFKTIDCFCRRSLHLENINKMVDYGTNEDEAHFSIDFIYQMIYEDGIPYFELFNDFLHPFDMIELEDLKTQNSKFDQYEIDLSHIRTTLNLSRIHVWQGNFEKAKEFAEYGLFQLRQNPFPNQWESMFKRLIEGDANFFHTQKELDAINDFEKKIREEMDALFGR